MRCTFNAIPQTSNLLKQSKLPFGVYIHPFIEDTVSSFMGHFYNLFPELNQQIKFMQDNPIIKLLVKLVMVIWLLYFVKPLPLLDGECVGS